MPSTDTSERLILHNLQLKISGVRPHYKVKQQQSTNGYEILAGQKKNLWKDKHRKATAKLSQSLLSYNLALKKIKNNNNS